MQPRFCHVFGRIHRAIEVWPDVGGARAVQFVTRQALGDVERLAGAHGIVCRQALIDGKPGPARDRRKLALELRQLIGPVLAPDLATSGPVHAT